MISETVYGILSVAAGITTITTNIFPVVIPQKANPPAITYQRDGSRYLRTFDGHVQLVEASFQIDCWASSVATAESLAAAVKSVLIDYSTAPITQVWLTNELNLFEAETELHRVLLQFTAWHIE